jgi:hypothetical protein
MGTARLLSSETNAAARTAPTGGKHGLLATGRACKADSSRQNLQTRQARRRSSQRTQAREESAHKVGGRRQGWGAQFTAIMRWTTGRAIGVAILGLNENERLSAGDAAVSLFPFKPRIVVIDLKSIHY